MSHRHHDIAELALEAVGDGFFDYRLEDGHTYYSPGVYHQLGYEFEAFVPGEESWLGLLHEDDLSRGRSLLAEYQASTRESHSQELRMRTATGDWRWVWTRGRVMERGAAGRAIRVVGTHSDVSQFRDHEKSANETVEQLRGQLGARSDQLRAASASLANQRAARERSEMMLQRLAQAIDQSPVSILITDLDGCIEYANARFFKVSGLSPTDVQGQTPRILKGELTSPRVFDELWRCIRRGEPWRGEFHNRRPDGSYYWEFAVISPLRDSNGRITHYMAVKEDITAAKESALLNARLNEELNRRERLAAIGNTVANVAHSIKNQLTVMLGGVHLINQGRLKEEWGSVVEGCTLTESSVVRVQNLLREMLEYSKPRELDITMVDLAEVFDWVKETTGPAARMRGVHVFTVVDHSARYALLDRGRLESALLNLATNAMDAMAAGGNLRLQSTRCASSRLPARMVILDSSGTIRRDGFSLVIEVTDTGGGISDDDLPQIFDPFFSTKGTRGTGLGLAGVQQCMIDHHGAVGVTSEVGTGTVMHMAFPPECLPEA